MLSGELYHGPVMKTDCADIYLVFAVGCHSECVCDVHDFTGFGRRRSVGWVDRHPVLCVKHGFLRRRAVPLEDGRGTDGRLRRRRRVDVTYGMHTSSPLSLLIYPDSHIPCSACRSEAL